MLCYFYESNIPECFEEKAEEKQMLKIFYGDMPKAIYNTEVYFKNTYADEWLLSEEARQIVKDIDHSTVVGVNAIDSPVLGMIPPTSLSGGVKTLLLILNDPKHIFNASTCGDNCAGWLLKLAGEKDITVNLNHIMDFGKEFEVYVINEKKTVNNMADLVLIAGKYV